MNKVRISCSVKLHAFHLSEQLERHDLLDKLYTIYHQRKNTWLGRLGTREDRELIHLRKVSTFPFLAPVLKWGNDPFRTNSVFDSLVARDLRNNPNYNLLIGWSGMSLRSMRQAKNDGKIVVLERGSTHIAFQIALLEEEYSRWGFRFTRDNRVIDQELQEYDFAGHIVVPSDFVKQSFLSKGISVSKLFKNNFGANTYFHPTKPKRSKYTILYVGSLSLRKGLPYLFEALDLMRMDMASYEVWFVGAMQKEIQSLVPRYKKPNWRFFGHVNHFELADLISQCSVAVHPSLEEGLSMVIPQLMSCGVPVIATTNTGGADIIDNGNNGYIVPIRSPEAIAERLSELYEDDTKREFLQNNALLFGQKFGTWDNYGDRYTTFLRGLLN